MAARFLLARMDRYLDECDERLTRASVQGLAEYLRVDRKILGRLCLAKTGLPACDLLRSRQLDRARHLLLDSDLKVGVIGLRCGFGTERTFHRVFLESEGVTPAAFRRRRPERTRRKPVIKSP